MVVRGTSEFQASWAEADVPERPITVLVVDLSMAELSTHLSAALVTAEAALAGDAAIARTYASPDRNLVKIYLTGVDEPAIDTLNATLDDPYVVCVDLRRLPRRYRSSTDPG